MVIKCDKNALLYIEPKHKDVQSDMKEYEWLKELMKTAIAGSGHRRDGRWDTCCFMGVHECVCGEESTSYEYLFPNNMYTNSLCLHYLEWHRDEIPQEEWIKLNYLKNNVLFQMCSQCKQYVPITEYHNTKNTRKYTRCLCCRQMANKYKNNALMKGRALY